MRLLPVLCFVACAPNAGTHATITVQNQFSQNVTLVKCVYSTGSVETPLAMAVESEPFEVTAGFEYAYALSQSATETAPQVIRTRNKIESFAGKDTTVVFSEESQSGKCTGLTQAEYEGIAKRVFPEDILQAYADILCR